MKRSNTMASKDSQSEESPYSQTQDNNQEAPDETMLDDGKKGEDQASETIFATKNRIRENLLKQFKMIKEIVKNELAETDETKEQQRLREIALDVNQLYAPSSQQDLRYKGKGSKQAKSFLQFQQLVQKEIELAFQQSGIAQRVQHLEKQNMYLYQIALEAPTVKQLDEAIGGDGEGSGYNIINSPDFQQKYENLKVNIIKRVKQSIKTQKKESTLVGSKASDENYKFGLHSLVSENQLFDGIQEQLLDAMMRQKASLERTYSQKFDKINAINFELRKSCLMEIHLLRETYFLQNTGQISDKEAALHAKTQMFRFDHGLDDQICELLEVKLKQVSVEYLNTIKKQEEVIEMQRLKLMKYKLLTPKTFGLLDLTLKEIFDALALIETDARKVWRNLISSYPTDYFVGVIEDTYGAFFDKDSQAKLTSEVRIITNELLADVQGMGNDFKKEKEAIFQQIRDQEVLFEELKQSYEKQVERVKSQTHEQIAKQVENETRKMARDFQMEKNIYVEAARRNKEKYQKIKAQHNDNEAKLCFFKWKVVTQAFKKTEGLESQFREKELRKLLSNEGQQKLKNSLQARSEKMEMYKRMYEDSKRELVDLKKRHNQIIAENVEYCNQVNMVREEMDQVFRQTNEVTIPRLRELEIELRVCKQQLQSSLQLSKKLQDQNMMIEEKYNIREKTEAEKQNPKERVVRDMLNQVMSSTYASKIMLQRKLETCLQVQVDASSDKLQKEERLAELGEFAALDNDLKNRLGSDAPNIDEIFRIKPSRNIQCQTDLSDLRIQIKQGNRIDQYGRTRYDVQEPKFEQDCQTDIDFELFEELQDSNNLYHQQKELNEELQMQLLEVAPTSSPKVEISNQNSSPSTAKKRSMSLLVTSRQNSLKDKVALGLKNQVSAIQKKSTKKLETPTSTAKKSNMKKHMPIYENEEDLLGKSSILHSNFDENKNNASKDSLPTPVYTKPHDDPGYQAFLDMEKMSKTERFDRIKFMYETNLELIEMIKDTEPTLYMQCVKELKAQAIESYNPENDILFNKDKDWLKRLYPQNQPEVFMRLQNLVNEKEQRKQKELHMKQEQRYFSMALTKNQNLSNLQTSLKKAFRSKSKKEQRIAQMQIQKQLHQLTKIDKFDPKPQEKFTEEKKQSKGDVNINVVHTSIVNLNDQTSFQGVKVNHRGASFGKSAVSSRQPVYNKQASPIQKAQQYYNLSPTQTNIEKPLQQFNQRPSNNLDLVVNPQTHVIITPTIELEKDSKTLVSKSPNNKSQLGSKSLTASNDTSPNNQLHFHPLKKLVFADEDQKSEGTIEIDQKNEKNQNNMMIQERIDNQEFMDEIQKNNEKLMEVQKKINQAQQDYVQSTLKTFTSNAIQNPPLIEIQDGGINFERTKMSQHPRERNIVISKQGTPFEAGDLNAWPQDEENTPLPYQMVAQKPIIHVPSANIKTPLAQKTQKKSKGGFQFNEISMSPDNFHKKNIFQDHMLINSPVNQSAVFNYPSPNQNLQQNTGKRRVRPFTGTKRRQNIHENAIKAADSSSKTSFNVVGQPVNNSSTNYGSLDFAHANQPGQNLRMSKFLGTVEGHPNLQYGLVNQPYSPNIQGNSSRVITQSPFLNDPSVPASAQFGQRGIAQNIHTFSHDIIHEHPQRNDSRDFFNNQFSEIKIQSTTNLNPLNNMNNTEQSQNINSEEMNKQSLALIQYSQQQIQNQQNYLNSCRETQQQLSPQVLEQKTKRFNEPLSSSTNASQAASKSKLSKNVKHRIQSASIRQSRLPNASIHFRDKQRVFLPQGGGNSSRIAGGNFQTYRKTENESRWVGDTQPQFPTSRPMKSPDSQVESKVDKFTIRQNSSHGSRTKRGALGGGFYTRNIKKKGKSNKTQEGTIKSSEPNNDDINLHMQPTFSNDMSGGELSHFVDKNGYRLSETPAKSALVSPQTAMSPALQMEVKMPNLENYIQEQI